jgi:hypothetical protein
VTVAVATPVARLAATATDKMICFIYSLINNYKVDKYTLTWH